MARPGALYRHIWVAAKGEEVVPAIESIAVAPVTAASRGNEEVDPAAKGHLSWMNLSLQASGRILSLMSWRNHITLEAGKRGGRPCVRGMRISVADVLGWLAAGMSHEEILSDYPELTEEDIRACLAYAADRERRVLTAA